MLKTMLATFCLKTFLGFCFIQEMKEMQSRLGVKPQDDIQRELLTAAIAPNILFLVIGVISFILVLMIKSFWTKDESNN
jgi:hypothetical protein